MDFVHENVVDHKRGIIGVELGSRVRAEIVDFNEILWRTGVNVISLEVSIKIDKIVHLVHRFI